jgi:hypothetical protein
MDGEEELMAMMKEVCLEKTKVNPEEKETIAEQQKSPKEEASVDIMEALEDYTGTGVWA